VVTSVVSDGAGKGRGARGKGRGDVVGDALGAFADGAVVDGVRADGVHFSAAAAGAERDDRPKGVVEFFPLAGGDLGGDFGRVFRVARFGEPAANHGDRVGRELFISGGLVERGKRRLRIE